MSWKLDVEATPFDDFVQAVDDTDATGEVGQGDAGLQITQAKAVLTALAKAGALGSGTIEASAAGHGSAPFNFIVSAREVEETKEEGGEEVEPEPIAPAGPAQSPGAVGGAPAPQHQAGVESTGVSAEQVAAHEAKQQADRDRKAAIREQLPNTTGEQRVALLEELADLGDV